MPVTPQQEGAGHRRRQREREPAPARAPSDPERHGQGERDQRGVALEEGDGVRQITGERREEPQHPAGTVHRRRREHRRAGEGGQEDMLGQPPRVRPFRKRHQQHASKRDEGDHARNHLGGPQRIDREDR
jgi:hypothetical protein